MWGIFLALIVAGLSYARAFFMPVVLAVLLALVFSPLRRSLERIGIPTSLSAFALVFSLMLGVLTVTASVAVPASEWISDAPQILRKVELRLSELKPVTDTISKINDGIDKVMDGGPVATDPRQQPAVSTGATAPDASKSQVVVQENTPQSYIMQVVASTPAVLAQFVFTMILLFFLLASGDLFLEKSVQVAPTRVEKARVVRIIFETERRLSRYLLTITLINLGLGISIGIAMWAFGMPSPLLFAVIGFLFNYVPYVGAMVGVAIAFAVGIVSLDLGTATIVAAVYFTLTSIEGQIVTPWLVGRNLRINTVVVFVAVMFWAWLWSVVGMLIALPLLVTLRAFSENIPALKSFAAFLSDARGADLKPYSESRESG
ncbi:AI-2E family transporter [Celeribacter litoreus]|uniref:AI-2E family transporter n=1 Tax=Celeribacter litoreus TaxID=2876714 RepID=UPI001CCDF043|nr:AI-2E family transporter [Celeribacter litoreus]MCA0044348.1 AI-2E family transporter [Celeribacter litoreus]